MHDTSPPKFLILKVPLGNNAIPLHADTLEEVKSIIDQDITDNHTTNYEYTVLYGRQVDVKIERQTTVTIG